MYLLDTNHISCWQRGRGNGYEQLVSHLRARDPSEVFVSIISFHEQVVGWNSYLARAKSPEAIVKAYSQFELILGDFSNMQKLSFDAKSMDVFLELKAQCLRVSTMDLRIASIAIANQITLVTNNTVDFARIQNLSLEDWMT
jgi:tRNA(fMet)-specific endonuclease VapC